MSKEPEQDIPPGPGARNGGTERDVHVAGFEALASPEAVLAELPASQVARETVRRTRQDIRNALAGRDARLVIVVGPCSIHDVDAATEYARRLADLRRKTADRLIVVMRSYFEKPRTSVGWKGLINDPHLDGSCDMETGLRAARGLLLAANDMSLPCGTEFLDPIVPQYIADLVAWAAVGARTTESQTHREMASGLSMPVGFKNATDGQIAPAVNALVSARTAQGFLGVDSAGRTAIVRTTGNPDVHIVLRGGGGRSNYSGDDIARTCDALNASESARPILVDCSHGNSGGDCRNQAAVFRYLLGEYVSGRRAILGMMLESSLVSGSQELGAETVSGRSITDECIDWETTEQLLTEAYEKLGA